MNNSVNKFNIWDWNKKLYTEREGKFGIPKDLGAQWFWDNFQIKSAPLYREECWYHIPIAWGDEVHKMITNIRQKFGDQVEFRQIKEKMAWLTVYYRVSEDLADKDKIKENVNQLIQIAQANLRDKDLHP